MSIKVTDNLEIKEFDLKAFKAAEKYLLKSRNTPGVLLEYLAREPKGEEYINPEGIVLVLSYIIKDDIINFDTPAPKKMKFIRYILNTYNHKFMNEDILKALNECVKHYEEYIKKIDEDEKKDFMYKLAMAQKAAVERIALKIRLESGAKE